MPRPSRESAAGRSASMPAAGNSLGNASGNRSAARSSRNASASRSAATSVTSSAGSKECGGVDSTSWSMFLSEALRASLSALPGRNVELPTLGIYSRPSWESFASCDQPGSSWNRSPRSSAPKTGKRSRGTSAVWPRSGTICSGTAYRLAPLARVIGGRGSGLWATPVAQPANGTPERFLERKRESVARGNRMGICLSDLQMQVRAAEKGMWSPLVPTPRAEFDSGRHRGRPDTLHSWVKMWPTPQAHDAAKGNPKRVGRYGTKHGGRNLNDWAARCPGPVGMIPTPHANCSTGAGTQGRKGGLNLQTFVRLWPTPRACQPGQGNPGDRGLTLPYAVKMSLSTSSTTKGGRTQSPVGGSLNPLWVEWLMGFPIGWTVSRAWAMRSSRRSRFSSGRRSMHSSAPKTDKRP